MNPKLGFQLAQTTNTSNGRLRVGGTKEAGFIIPGTRADLLGCQVQDIGRVIQVCVDQQVRHAQIGCHLLCFMCACDMEDQPSATQFFH